MFTGAGRVAGDGAVAGWGVGSVDPHDPHDQPRATSARSGGYDAALTLPRARCLRSPVALSPLCEMRARDVKPAAGPRVGWDATRVPGRGLE